MLLGQNGGGHQIHHLLALLHRLKGCTNGNFSFTIPHISADKPIHDAAALHVSFCVRNGIQLVLSLFKGKHFFKLPLPDGILAILISFS